MSQNKVSYRKLAINLLKAVGIFYLIYFLSVNLIGAILEDEKDNAVISLVLMLIFYLIYTVAFYLMVARKSADEFSMNIGNGGYSFKSDLTAVIAGEGKALAIIYGVCAAIYTLCDFVPGIGFIRVILMPIFPIYLVLSIPVLSAVLGWIMVTALSVGAIVFGHARIHKQIKQGKL